MDPPPHPPPSSTTITANTTQSNHLPPVPTPTPKLRLMVSYGGHIVPRPNDKALFYANGETRIVAVDRFTTASSLFSLTTHLSRTLFNNRPFHLKYQLPNEDFDSLISVTTDEDLVIMLEEHDRISAISSSRPSRIRLFLFPTKPESIGSALLDRKAETWFSDALKGTGIVQRGQSADAGLIDGLMGLDIMSGGPEMAQLEGNNVAERKNVVENGGGVPESMVLETTSSFGSTSSSVSMSNLPPIGVQSEDGGVGFLDKKGRVPSSASLESDTSLGSPAFPPKPAFFQDSQNQVVAGVPTFTIGPESAFSDPSSMIQMQKTVQVSGYHLPQQSDRKQFQNEVQYVQENPRYIPQYSTGPLPHASYYPVYQIPMHQQHHSPYAANQQYPVYLVPIRPVQPYNMPMQTNANNNPAIASSRPPLPPQTATIIPPMVHKEIMTPQPIAEPAAKVHGTAQVATTLVPTIQGQQQFMAPPEPLHPSSPVSVASTDTSSYAGELDENLAYTQIYKTQPSVPVLPLHYQQITTQGATVLLSDSSVPQHLNVKHPATSHPQ